MRASALAPWKTTLVCIVPPSIGSGCANTTAARGGPAGLSISASSGPTAPGISRRTSANTPPRVAGTRVLDHERRHDSRELVRSRDHPEMAGALDGDDASMRQELEIFQRHPDRNHPLEPGVA